MVGHIIGGREPLRRYLILQRDWDRKLIRILRGAESDARLQLRSLADRSGPGALVRSLQLRLAQSEIKASMSSAWRRIGDEIAAGRLAAGTKAIDVARELSEALGRGSLSRSGARALSVALRTSASNALDLVRIREGMSRVRLSRRVYVNSALSRGKVDLLVSSALARGQSARELARSVLRFIRPDVPGGMSYAAMRLGRTELNNAFHTQSILTNQEYPWVESMQWNLSGSHPKPDICDTLARQTSHRKLPPGAYFVNEVPDKPHPHCLCYVTPVVMDEDAFVAAFKNGSFDSFLEGQEEIAS